MAASITVIGAGGRMGRMIISAITETPDVHVAGAVELKGAPTIGLDAAQNAGLPACDITITESLEIGVGSADAVIDFTTPNSTLATLAVAVAHETPIVIGTTGLSESDMDAIKKASSTIAIVQSPNMSVGINLLFKLVAQVTPLLQDSYDIEIIDIHHRHKKDAPSGTAQRFAEIIAQSAGRNLDNVGVYGRHGICSGDRKRESIGVHTLRGGEVTGDHTILYLGSGERIELKHQALSRMTFAQGAVRAAQWIIDKKPGLYSMQDVLGF